jgi:hypothetical protein
MRPARNDQPNPMVRRELVRDGVELHANHALGRRRVEPDEPVADVA